MERNLLVSDYDDTFKTSNTQLYQNIEAVKKFRENGNIFTIATSRSYESIKSEIDRYGIEYDYLSCLDGANLYDNENNLIDATFIEEIDRLDIDSFKEKYPMIKSIEPHTYQDKILYYTILTKILSRTKELKEEIRRNMSLRTRSIPGLIQVQPSMTIKSDSIEYLKRHLGIDDENIFTIGDSSNDIDMVRDYNGFNVIFAAPGLYRVSQRPYRMVKDLVQDIETGKVKRRVR